MKRLTLAAIIFFVIVVHGCKKDPLEFGWPEVVYDPHPVILEQPAHFRKMIIPEDNPMTEEGISLGKRLFYDPILSADSTQSCASCHNQSNNFTDNGKRFSVGIDGSVGTRTSMSLANVGFLDSLFWDGRIVGLEEQALLPVTNPIEMNNTWENVEKKLNASYTYHVLFKRAFNIEYIDSLHVAKALAQFERTLISANSKWDRYIQNVPFGADNRLYLTESEYRGFAIFKSEDGDCFHCHGASDLLTTRSFHNNGLDELQNQTDSGLMQTTGLEKDRARFKAPSLRNIEYSSPYMHDGRFKTLEEVVEFYSFDVSYSPTIDPSMKKVAQHGINLSPQQRADLVAFLKTFSDEEFITNPKFSNPFQ